jgi:hypothetical protein
MALTEKQVLSDGGNLVKELVAELSTKGLAYKDNVEALRDMKRIFEASVKVIEKMLIRSKPPVIH